MAEIGKIKDFFKWYLAFDPKDMWNWILLVIAILLLWWGIKTMLVAVTIKP